MDAAAVSSTCSHAAVSEAQSFSKNQFDKSYQERSRKFNEKRLLQADYSFSNVPENSGFSVLLRRSMELIGSFEEGSLAPKALVSNSPPVLQTKSVRIHDFCFYVMPKIIHFQVFCNLLNTSHIQTNQRAPIHSPLIHASFVEEKTTLSFQTQKSPMQVYVVENSTLSDMPEALCLFATSIHFISAANR